MLTAGYWVLLLAGANEVDDKGAVQQFARRFPQVGMLVNFARKKSWLKQDPRLTYKPPKEELKDPNPFSDDEQLAIRIVGATARTRVMRYVRATRAWVETF